MGKVCEEGKMFFSKEEYKNLRHQHLSRNDYKKFISRLNARISDELILNGEGYALPFNLGHILIQKRFKPNGIYAAYKGKKKEFNFHSMGYVYNINFHRNTSRSIKYSEVYTKGSKVGDNPTVDFDLFKYTAHRDNIRRPLNKIIKTYKRDYPNAKDNTN